MKLFIQFVDNPNKDIDIHTPTDYLPNAGHLQFFTCKSHHAPDTTVLWECESPFIGPLINVLMNAYAANTIAAYHFTEN
jgi:hypothetical protein